MKERIERFIVLVLISLGVVSFCKLIQPLMPTWMFFSLCLIIIAYCFWHLANPEGENNYWYYTYIEKDAGRLIIGRGVQKTNINDFDFNYFRECNPTCNLLMVKSISKKQYNEIKASIQKENKS